MKRDDKRGREREDAKTLKKFVEKKNSAKESFFFLFLLPFLSRIMLGTNSLSAAAFCGAPVHSTMRVMHSATPQQQRRQRQLVFENAASAPLSVMSSSLSSIGLQQRRHRRQQQCRLSPCLAIQASASQSTELPPELKRIVTAFSMVCFTISRETDEREAAREDSSVRCR